MRKGVLICLLVLGLFSLGIEYGTTGEGSKDVPRVSKEKARSWMGSEGTVVLDVRPKDQWEYSQYKIRGAKYQDPQKIDQWADAYSKDTRLVLYCA